MYHRRDEKKEDRKPPTSEAKAKAEKAWKLLHDWDRVPGTQEDKSVSLDELRAWMKKTRELAEQEGRLVVCDITIGNVFVHSPTDADGTWPCAAVQQVIEETPSEELERGFMTGMFNSRGIWSRSLGEGGKQERELAAKYQAFSDKVLLRFPKVAKLLANMASDYAAQAKRVDLEAKEDLG